MLRLGWRVLLGTTLAAAVFLTAVFLLVDAPVKGSRPALATAQASLRATAVAPTPRPGAASTAVVELSAQLVEEGDYLYARGELSPAIYRYTQAAESSAGKANARLARALVSWGDAAGAVEQAKRSAALDSSSASLTVLCLAQHWAETYTAAADSCQRAIAKDPGAALPRAYLAMVYADVGRRSEAKTSLLKALSLGPDDPEVLRAAGHVYSLLGQAPDGEAALGRAKALAPRSVDVRLTLSRLYKRDDAVERAVDELTLAIEELPPSPQPLAELGLIRYQQKRYSEAAEGFEGALALDPDRASTSQLLGWSEYYLGDYARALAQFQNAARLSPQDSDAQAGIGWASLGLKRFAEAKSAFEAALAISPSLASAESGLRAVQAATSGR